MLFDSESLRSESNVPEKKKKCYRNAEVKVDNFGVQLILKTMD